MDNDFCPPSVKDYLRQVATYQALNRLVSIEAWARWHHYSPSAVCAMIRRRELVAYKVKRRWWVDMRYYRLRNGRKYSLKPLEVAIASLTSQQHNGSRQNSLVESGRS